MRNFSRTLVTVVRLARGIAVRGIAIAAISVASVPFGLNDGRHAYAHGDAEPEPAKPAEVKPPEPPPPPRPTEYPRGLTEKHKPGEQPIEQKMPPPPAANTAGTDQPMPSQVPGGKPGDASKPDAEDVAPKPAQWVPPKRYHFVADTYTGLAIGGNDAVAFFVDGEPRQGSPDHELDWGGTTWHFLNEGNLAAFKQSPEIYAPRFGGRCAFALSQGLLVEGMPQFFVVHRDRLYLFANAGYRAAFLTNPDALARQAEQEWPVLTRGEP